MHPPQERSKNQPKHHQCYSRRSRAHCSGYEDLVPVNGDPDPRRLLCLHWGLWSSTRKDFTVLTHIQTQRSPVDMTISSAFLPSILIGSVCSTCGQATICASCNRCHYCEDIDLPCGATGSLQARHVSIMPLHSCSSGNDHRILFALLAEGQGTLPPVTCGTAGLFELEPEENEGNGHKQSSALVDPDIPLNFDDLTDKQLEELIRSFVAQAATLYRSGTFIENEQPQSDQTGKTSLIVSGFRRSISGIYGSAPVTPVAQWASLFSSRHKEGGAK